MKLDAKQLRDLEDTSDVPIINRFPIYFILDNIYDTYNIGGLFRLADAFAIEKLYICGDSETPPNHRIKKASIGTYKIVPWEYKKTAVEAIEDLKEQHPDIQVASIEQSETSIPYTDYDFPRPIPPRFGRLALIVGNETTGVSQEALDASDVTLEIPMYGINKSFNVIISMGIVMGHVFTDKIKGQNAKIKEKVNV